MVNIRFKCNFLYQSTGSVIVWNGFDQLYIPLNNEVTTTSGDTYNIAVHTIYE